MSFLLYSVSAYIDSSFNAPPKTTSALMSQLKASICGKYITFTEWDMKTSAKKLTEEIQASFNVVVYNWDNYILLGEKEHLCV